MKILLTAAVIALSAPCATMAAPAPVDQAPVDQAFVAMVSQGGMFEVQASKLAASMAQAQDVQDFANSEVHDHTLVGAKLKTIADQDGIAVSQNLNAQFQAKLDKLMTLEGPAFDAAYMADMADIHDKDGAAFAKEAAASTNPRFKAFAAETHVIVQRHIGAIHGASPPAKT